VILLAVEANWKLAVQEEWRRDAVRTKSQWFREELQRSGFNTGLSECQIVPLIVGGNEETLAFSERLQEEGIAAVAIRPPTVPIGSARIRFTVTATHQVKDLEWALERIRKLGKSLGVII
jgi:8-amino-7-oxononanoate synthase